MGGTRVKKYLIINIYPNSDLADSLEIVPLLEICFLEEVGSGICVAAVAGVERFFMSSMDECNTASHTWPIGLVGDLSGGKGGAWVALSPYALQIPSYAF